jgi:hypothetical protein
MSRLSDGVNMVCMTKFRVERRPDVEVFTLFEITTKEIWQKEKPHETETEMANKASTGSGVSNL